MKKTIITAFTLMIPLFVVAGDSCDNCCRELTDFEVSLDTPYKQSAPYLERVYVHDTTQLIIELSDKSHWIVRNQDKDTIIDKLSDDWLKGDEIRVKPRDPIVNEGHYLLKNVRNNKGFYVDVFSNPVNCSGGVAIKNLDRNGYTLVTEDGKTWSIGWFGSFTSTKWRVGDRIVFNKSNFSREEDYLLINLNNGAHTWASLTMWK